MQIWHNYKSGEFVMRLEDGAQMRTLLSASYAMTTTPLQPDAFEQLKSQPLRVEHTSHTNKWSVYQTDGLPEAIAAGEADLERAKERLADKECVV